MGFTDRGAPMAVILRPQQSGQEAQAILPLEVYPVGGLFKVSDFISDANTHTILPGVPVQQNGPIYRLQRIVWRALTAGSQGILTGTSSGDLYSAVNAPGGVDNFEGLIENNEGLTIQAVGFTTPNIYQVAIFYDLVIDPTLQ